MIFTNAYVYYALPDQGQPKSGEGVTSVTAAAVGDNDPSSSAQFGAGPNDAFINQVADLVTKKIQGNNSVPSPHFNLVNPNWKYYEIAQPTVVSTDSTPNTRPPDHFSNPIFTIKSNDSFDEKHLLKKVPKPFQNNAALLLKAFDERPNELTWDSSGNVYINEQSVPNCNMFNIFPYLFRKRSPRTLTGIADVLLQLKQMGLSHLVQKNTKVEKKEVPTSSTPAISDSTNWWYLGP